MSKVVIRVPATSANMGPGFDSVGVAFQVYLTVIIEEKKQRFGALITHWAVTFQRMRII